MSHDIEVKKTNDFISDAENRGASLQSITASITKDAIAYRHEFIDRLTLIPFDYNISDENRMVDSTGKTVEQLIDPDDVGADRLGRTLRAEQSLLNDPDAEMVATASPDLGFGRSFVYLYTRTENNTVQATAIEFPADDTLLGEFFRNLGVAGQADTTESTNFEKPLVFSKKISTDDIVESARNALGESPLYEVYLKRLKFDAGVFPIKIEERNRQVSEIANNAMDRMLADDAAVTGLAAFVYGAIETVSTDSFSNTEHDFQKSKQKTETSIHERGEFMETNETHHDEILQIGRPSVSEAVIDLLSDEYSEQFMLLSRTPEGSAQMTETDADTSKAWISIAQETLKIPREKAESLLSEIVEIHAVMNDASQMLDTAVTIGTAQWGALAALDMLTISAQNLESVEKPISAHRDDSIEKTNSISGPLSELNNIYGVRNFPERENVLTEYQFISKDIVSDPRYSDISVADVIKAVRQLHEAIFSPEYIVRILEGSMQEFIDAVREQDNGTGIAEAVDWQTVSEIVHFIAVLDAAPSEKRSAMIADEQRKTSEEILLVASIIRQADFRTKEVQGNDDQVREHSMEKKYDPAEGFAFAVSFWILLRLYNYAFALKSLESVIRQKRVSAQSSPTEQAPLISGKETGAEGLIQKESAPWLLLSIIWHLSAIREHGKTSVKQKPKQKKKQSPLTSVYGSLPGYTYGSAFGIIYAYHS